MIQIDMEMPKTCNECPCSCIGFMRYCRINERDFDVETITDNFDYKRQKWCPLKEGDANGNKENL